MAASRCFLQLSHPGREHQPDRGTDKTWNRQEHGHARKFMQMHGQWTDENGNRQFGDLYAWGEWEPESELVRTLNPPDGDWLRPRWLWRPHYVPRESYEAAREIEGVPGLEPLAVRHQVGPAGQRIQDAFRRCDRTAAAAVEGFHSVSSRLRRTMSGKNDVWYQPKPDNGRLAKRYSAQRSHLLLPMRFRTTNGRLTAVWSPVPSFGWWVPVLVDGERAGKALVAWCNSTPVRLMLLNRRAMTLTYPTWQLTHLREIRVPTPGNPAWDVLAAAYAEGCNLELLPMRQAEECPARQIIDAAAALVLDVDKAQIAEWRRKLAREPTVSNQRAQT